MIEYFDEIKTEFKNTSECLSGAWNLDEFESSKKLRTKILRHTPFNYKVLRTVFMYSRGLEMKTAYAILRAKLP